MLLVKFVSVVPQQILKYLPITSPSNVHQKQSTLAINKYVNHLSNQCINSYISPVVRPIGPTNRLYSLIAEYVQYSLRTAYSTEPRSSGPSARPTDRMYTSNCLYANRRPDICVHQFHRVWSSYDVNRQSLSSNVRMHVQLAQSVGMPQPRISECLPSGNIISW